MTSGQICFDVARVEKMMETLERLAGGETDARMAISGQRDYLDALAFGVNAIAQELVFLKEAAEAANAAKSQFLAMMSHEIRTPLSVVLGICELLRAREMSVDDREKYLDRIQANGSLLRAIVDNVLDLSKIESGKIEISLAMVSPHDALLEVVNSLEMAARKKGIEFTCQIQPEVPALVQVDPTRFRQVLTNIIANSIKFTQQGSVQVEMKCTKLNAQDPSEHLQILIRDTGVGIDPSQQRNLFQAFQQADSETSRMFGGTGLGLMLARRFARLMNGDVTLISSAVGVGSVFSIHLPIQLGLPESRAADPSVTGSEKSSKPSGPTFKPSRRLSGMRILIGEDCEDLQLLYRDVLEGEGALVEIAGNGEEVLETIGRRDFHILLMDVNMPKLSGIEATKRLREMGCQLPIVALTAEIFAKRLEECRLAGCTTYVQKPFYSEDLISTLLKLVDIPREPLIEQT